MYHLNRWTKEQEYAIYARNSDLLVSAAAGSGKTAVLVERIIKQIIGNTEDNQALPQSNNTIDIDEILVVTFTNAAAGEMRERIGKAISSKMETTEDIDIKLKLQNQLTLLVKSDIRTIHSFCQSIIREYYFLLDLDPSIRTADTTEIKIITHEVIDDYFEELYNYFEFLDDPSQLNPDFSTDIINFFDLLEIFSEETKDHKIKELVIRLSSFAKGFPNPEEILKSLIEPYENVFNEVQKQLENNLEVDYNKIFANLPWIDYIKKDISDKVEFAISSLESALEFTRSDEKYSKQHEHLKVETNLIKGFLEFINSDTEESNNFTLWRQKYLSSTYEKRMPAYKIPKEISEDDRIYEVAQKDKYMNMRKNATEKFKSIEKKYLNYSLENQVMYICNLYETVRDLITLTIEYMKRYADVKKQRMIMDFGDYEHFALKILLEPESTVDNIIPTKYAKEVRQRYKEIMIDEYQDSNMIQEMILSSVSGEFDGKNNRFMVGDVKQSIYSFRLAMPEIFNKKDNTYIRYENSNSNDKAKLIVLDRNFRSRKNILDGINFIFKQIMTVDFGEIDYSKAMLKEGVPFLEPEDGQYIDDCNEFILIDSDYESYLRSLGFDEDEIQEKKKGNFSKNSNSNNNDNDNDCDMSYKLLKEMSRQEVELRVVAKKIKEMIKIGFHVKDGDTYRLMNFGDVAILLRSLKSFETVFDKVFNDAGIDYYAESSVGYFDVMEVDTILNVLRVIDNPRQDVPIISLLHSPIYGIDINELLEIRFKSEGIYFDALLEYHNNFGIGCDDYNEVLHSKVSKFFNDFKFYRENFIDLGIYELLALIYEKSGYYDYLGIGNGGNIRQGNLKILLKKAQNYENASYNGLFFFIKYIEDMKIQEEKERGAKDENSVGNSINIMTIHKSKGLEFPVVFLCNGNGNFNEVYKREYLLTNRYGSTATVGVKFTDLENRAVYKTLSHSAVVYGIKRENLEEELRILYVALTRAKEKLIVVGSVDNFINEMNKWYMIASERKMCINPAVLRSCNTYGDWIIPSLLRHPSLEIDDNIRKSCESFYDEYCCAFFEDSSRWRLGLEYKEDIINSIEGEILSRDRKRSALENLRASSSSGSNDNIVDDDKIDNFFSWEYKFSDATKLKGKTSITEIKKNQQDNLMMIYDDFDLFGYSDNKNHEGIGYKKSTDNIDNIDTLEFREFLENTDESISTGAIVGTAVHKFMELLDFKIDYTLESIEEYSSKLVKRGILKNEEVKEINFNSIYNFFQSSIGERIRKCKLLEKEHVFAMLLSVDEVDDFSNTAKGVNEVSPSDKILVNGMIDCYFIDEFGKVVLVDYKNDKIETEKDFKERYGVQLNYYKLALERSLGFVVEEVYIYSFYLEKEILIN